MNDAYDMDDVRFLIGEWRSEAAQRARSARELSARIHRPAGTARSPDGLVSVTVGPRDELLGWELGTRSDDGRRRTPPRSSRRPCGRRG
ncbi:hypothetical protein ACWT_1028 [Actinoplanes sp. SE50]|uniref:hypothetical protein n=1 Tax=unclassified Actinoplanes TaxID=2626549 RepID=UPI00023ECA8E|nr:MULTISPECIES: hypothetical protein [unclassified Actinoplanes]AEV82044.1 hypothetical protein ACPL_1147 [Actinoplanes sp. SE50/110]ATO80443.1 hypothetical protein ACWT_1028 [Actinoplanes sp. SE50]SLL97850.1 hypothetical protein ACSP50_1061 [Actinoplanes sp. SE50/110]